MMAARSPAKVDAVRLGRVAPAQADLPGLDRVGTRLAHGLTAALAAAGGAAPVAPGQTRTMLFSDWKAELPPAVAVARYRDRRIKGGILLSLSPVLMASLVDRFYGGDGAVDAARSLFGAAEQKLFDRFARACGTALAAAWADVELLEPTLAGAGFSIDDIAAAKPGDMVVVQCFATAGHSAADTIEIVYPLVALRGFAKLQGAVAEVVEEADPVWRRRLSDAVKQARLPVRTIIARPTVPLAKLMALAPGDFIPVTLPARVPLTVAGRLLAHGTIGEANGRAALMIDKLEPGAAFDD